MVNTDLSEIDSSNVKIEHAMRDMDLFSEELKREGPKALGKALIEWGEWAEDNVEDGELPWNNSDD